jgi:hypothetical protein
MQSIASRESYLDYSGLDCKIIRIDELAQLEQVTNSIINNCPCIPLKSFRNIHKLIFPYRNCHVLLLELPKKLWYQGMVGPLKVVLGVAEVFLFRKAI